MNYCNSDTMPCISAWYLIKYHEPRFNLGNEWGGNREVSTEEKGVRGI